MDEIKKGDYVVFKKGASFIDDDKRLETRFPVVLVGETSVGVLFPGLGIFPIEKSRLELAPNQEEDGDHEPDEPKRRHPNEEHGGLQ